MATPRNRDDVTPNRPSGKQASPRVVTDLPEMPDVTEAELDLLELHVSDLVTELLGQPDKTTD